MAAENVNLLLCRVILQVSTYVCNCWIALTSVERKPGLPEKRMKPEDVKPSLCGVPLEPPDEKCAEKVLLFAITEVSVGALLGLPVHAARGVFMRSALTLSAVILLMFKRLVMRKLLRLCRSKSKRKGFR